MKLFQTASFSFQDDSNGKEDVTEEEEDYAPTPPQGPKEETEPKPEVKIGVLDCAEEIEGRQDNKADPDEDKASDIKALDDKASDNRTSEDKALDEQTSEDKAGDDSSQDRDKTSEEEKINDEIKPVVITRVVPVPPTEYVLGLADLTGESH